MSVMYAKLVIHWSINLAFTVRICNDVLDDVLHYGIRMELVALQLTGKRFDCIIQTRFPEKPFQLINIKFLVCCVIQTISRQQFSSNFVDILHTRKTFFLNDKEKM